VIKKSWHQNKLNYIIISKITNILILLAPMPILNLDAIEEFFQKDIEKDMEVINNYQLHVL
jgi:hypothetical protein